MGVILNESFIIDTSDSLERNRKEKEYMDYIYTHLANVKKAFANLFVPLLNQNYISELISVQQFREAVQIVIPKIKVHDASKFSDEEFDAYRAHWYPTEAELNADEDIKFVLEEKYNDAWKHHYTNNDHHPMYWVNPDTNTIRDMELDAIIHMMCDWESVSMTIGGNILDWFENNSEIERSNMTANTLNIVNDIMYNVIRR